MLQGHQLQCSLLLFLVVLLRLLIHTHAQSDDGFDMRFRKIFPCQEISHLDSNVSLHLSDILAVQANLTYCDRLWNTSQYNVCYSSTIVAKVKVTPSCTYISGPPPTWFWQFSASSVVLYTVYTQIFKLAFQGSLIGFYCLL